MSLVIVPDLAKLELEDSQPEIYDRPVGLRLLFIDPRTGSEHYLVRYPEGLQAQRHTHSTAHTIVVLDGTLVVNGELLGPGGYVHIPAGEVMHHEPAPGSDCLFVTIFSGRFDVSPV